MGFIKDIVSAPFKALGKIPVLGDIFEKAGPLLGPIASMIPGVGPILGAALGGLGGGMQGGWGGAAKGAFMGMSAAELRKAMEQARKDQEQARKLTNEAMGIARGRYNEQAPMRQGFYQGVGNLQDRTNPFSTDIRTGNPLSQAGGAMGLGGLLGGKLGALGGGGGGGGMLGGSGQLRPGALSGRLLGGSFGGGPIGGPAGIPPGMNPEDLVMRDDFSRAAQRLGMPGAGGGGYPGTPPFNPSQGMPGQSDRELLERIAPFTGGMVGGGARTSPIMMEALMGLNRPARTM